eukprot:CAMPEP_0172734152 /NCGR_PEP_ID=MMETSP1074-20121228/109171_1 /TAXON_ID=2916 /ORGANISM="Ceratium fusus, Strain PA161109" /LENGTH=180 /DNA_ID=CAMNT_0013562871 /DNA_START=925 /DNA_END=1467 /DNA_ORIENTATION=-
MIPLAENQQITVWHHCNPFCAIVALVSIALGQLCTDTSATRQTFRAVAADDTWDSRQKSSDGSRQGSNEPVVPQHLRVLNAYDELVGPIHGNCLMVPIVVVILDDVTEAVPQQLRSGMHDACRENFGSPFQTPGSLQMQVYYEEAASSPVSVLSGDVRHIWLGLIELCGITDSYQAGAVQ